MVMNLIHKFYKDSQIHAKVFFNLTNRLLKKFHYYYTVNGN